MNGVSVIAGHYGGSHDQPRCSAKTGADADPNLLTSPASENKISHLHKFGSDRILDILLILCSVVIGTRETKFFPERPADVAMPVQAVRVGHSLSFRRSRGSPGYSTCIILNEQPHNLAMVKCPNYQPPGMAGASHHTQTRSIHTGHIRTPNLKTPTFPNTFQTQPKSSIHTTTTYPSDRYHARPA